MALSPRTMQIESCGCNPVPFQDRVWEPCVHHEDEAGLPSAEPVASLTAKGARYIPRNEVEAAGGLSPCLTSPTSVPMGQLALSGVWTFLLCILQDSPAWPVTWSGQSGPSLSCGVIQMASVVVFSLLPLRLLFPVLDRSFDTESTLCGLALREAPRPPLPVPLLQHTGSLQWRWPLVVMRQRREDHPGWAGGGPSSVCRCGGHDGIGFLWRASWSPRTVKERSLLCLAFLISRLPLHCVLSCFRNLSGSPFSEGHFPQCLYHSWASGLQSVC